MSSKKARRPATASRLSAPSTELLTLAEVLKELKVARSTYYEWLQRDKAPKSIKYPNGKIMVRRSDLEQWMADLEVTA